MNGFLARVIVPMLTVFLTAGCGGGGNPDAPAVTDPDPSVTDLPQDRAALFVQTDRIAEGLEASRPSSQPDLTALCLRLDGIEKTVLVKGADAFELTGKQASNLRLAALLCESDPQGAASQLRDIRTAQGS